MRITDWSGGQDDLVEAESVKSLPAGVDSLLDEALLAGVDSMPEDFLVLGVQLRQQSLMGCTVVLEESH